MKNITKIQTLLIIILFGVILFMDNSFLKKRIIQRNMDSVYFSQKYSIFFSNRIDSFDNELLIKTIDLGRYDAALEGLDENCKKQFSSHLVE